MKQPKVFKRPGSPYYWYRLFSGGRETWHSTEKTKKDEAETIAADARKAQRGEGEVEQYFNILVAKLAALPPAEQVEVRQRYARRLMMLHASTVAMTVAWDSWKDSPLKGNPGARTLSGYSAIWSRFAKWAGENSIKHLHEITPLHVQDYGADLWRANVSPATFNAHTKFLRSMFAVLQEKAGVLENPWTKIKSLRKDTHGRVNFTADELTTICRRATGSFRYMIGIGLYTGMRLGDVLNLRWTDIHKDKIEIVPMKTKRLGKRIVLPVHPVLAVLLAERRKQVGGDFVFPDELAEYRKDGSAIAHQFRDFLQECGIHTVEVRNEDMRRKRAAVLKGFHSLRHSFVSLCAMNRVPQVAIQDLVGHGSPAMTALYSHANFDQKLDAIAALPDTFAPSPAKKTHARRGPPVDATK